MPKKNPIRVTEHDSQQGSSITALNSALKFKNLKKTEKEKVFNICFFFVPNIDGCPNS